MSAESNSPSQLTQKSGGRKRKEPVISIILQEILLTGLFLCVFATFHHVLPRMGYLTGPVSTPTAIATPEPTPAPTAAEEDDGLTEWQRKFSDKFTDEVVWTESSYSSPTVAIDVTMNQGMLNGYLQTWYVADIYIASIENFQTYAENGSFERYIATPAESLAEMAGALISINGDYANAQVQYGFYVRNGLMYSDTQTACDICALYYDGTMETYGASEYTVADIVAKQPYQVWKFGPELLDENGQPLTSFNTGEAIAMGNPRSAIGYYEPGHYCFVTVDGRQSDWSRGMTIEELAQLFADLGCKAAYNLDGGASATMTFNYKLINRQSSERNIGDILIIKELDGTEEAGK